MCELVLRNMFIDKLYKEKYLEINFSLSKRKWRYGEEQFKIFQGSAAAVTIHQFWLANIFFGQYNPVLFLNLNYIVYPHNKVTGCLFVCLSVPKDLTNCRIDEVLLNRIALIGPRKVYNYFGGGYHHHPKIYRTQKFFFKLKNLKQVLGFNSPLLKCPQRPLGGVVATLTLARRKQ